MAVAELLNEIAKPEYAGKTDAEIVAALNAWGHAYIPCATKSLSIMFVQVGLQGLVEVAREKDTIDDALWTRWKMLLGVMADPDIPTVSFDAEPMLIQNLLNSFFALGIITQTQHTWLIDLGVKSWTIGRKAFARDVTALDIAASRDLASLDGKVKSRRQAVEDEYTAHMAEVQTAHDELQKQDGELKPIGDKNFVPEWEK